MALHSTAVYGTVSLPKKLIFELGQILKLTQYRGMGVETIAPLLGTRTREPAHGHAVRAPIPGAPRPLHGALRCRAAKALRRFFASEREREQGSVREG